jgi:cell division protein FtsI/penicillin-binding protein 2
MKAFTVYLTLLVLFGLIIILNAAPSSTKVLTGTKFANTTIYAAMILTDPAIAEVLGRDFHKVPQGVNGTARQNADARVQHAKMTASGLPFAVDFWYIIFVKFFYLFFHFLICFSGILCMHHHVQIVKQREMIVELR